MLGIASAQRQEDNRWAFQEIDKIAGYQAVAIYHLHRKGLLGRDHAGEWQLNAHPSNDVLTHCLDKWLSTWLDDEPLVSLVTAPGLKVDRPVFRLAEIANVNIERCAMLVNKLHRNVQYIYTGLAGVGECHISAVLSLVGLSPRREKLVVEGLHEAAQQLGHRPPQIMSLFPWDTLESVLSEDFE